MLDCRKTMSLFLINPQHLPLSELIYFNKTYDSIISLYITQNTLNN